MKLTIQKAAALLLLFILDSQLCIVFAQGTAFTYQGRLNDDGNPASGIYDLRFTIYDSTNSPGKAIAGPITNAATTVGNGLFTVTLDFGAGVFTGPARWLQVDVRTNGGGGFISLLPRQPLTATPYAVMAGAIVPGGIPAGVYTNAIVFNNASNQFFGNGGGLTNLNASQVTFGTLPLAQLPGYLAQWAGAPTNAYPATTNAVVGLTAGSLISLSAATNANGGINYTVNASGGGGTSNGVTGWTVNGVSNVVYTTNITTTIYTNAASTNYLVFSGAGTTYANGQLANGVYTYSTNASTTGYWPSRASDANTTFFQISGGAANGNGTNYLVWVDVGNGSLWQTATNGSWAANLDPAHTQSGYYHSAGSPTNGAWLLNGFSSPVPTVAYSTWGNLFTNATTNVTKTWYLITNTGTLGLGLLAFSNNVPSVGVTNGSANVSLVGTLNVTNNGAANGVVNYQMDDTAGNPLLTLQMENNSSYWLADISGTIRNQSAGAWTLPSLRFWGNDPSWAGDKRSAVFGLGTVTNFPGPFGTANEGGVLWAEHLNNADNTQAGGQFSHQPIFVGWFNGFGWIERYAGYNSADWGSQFSAFPSAAVDIFGSGSNFPAFRIRSSQNYGGLYSGSLSKTGLVQNLGTNFVWVDDTGTPQYFLTSTSPNVRVVTNNSPTILTNTGGFVAGPTAQFTGNGSGLTNLNASGLTGSLPTATLPGITTNVSNGGITFYITNGLIMRVSSP